MDILLAFLAVLGGTAIPVQAGINAQLQTTWAQNSVLAAAVSFAVGAIALWSYVLLMRVNVPALNGSTQIWHWFGGFLGAYLVVMTIYTAPKLGATTMTILILAGQVCSSVALDHFGLLGYAQKTISPLRFLGVCFVAFGVFIIKRF